MFNKYLVFIELAKKNKCSKDSKWFGRKQNGVAFISIESYFSKKKLSLNLSVRFSGLSKSMDFFEYNECQPVIVCTVGINVSFVVEFDEIFVKTSIAIFGLKNIICSEGNTNLLTYKRCIYVMFFCQYFGNRLHHFECGAKMSSYIMCNSHIMLELENFLAALKSFLTDDDIYRAVDE